MPLPAWGQPLDPELFKSSTIISVEISKKKLKEIYQEGGHNKTLHCGCFFDKIQQVHPKTCDQADREVRRKRNSEILHWFHAVSIPEFSGSLKCWQQEVCGRAGEARYKGGRCCAEISPRFKVREADMHNLFPTIARLGGGNSTPARKEMGLSEYNYCKNKNSNLATPRSGVRGDIARAYFYMAYQYRLSIDVDLEDKLRRWHLMDPPDAWEETRNSMIEIVQGNRNAFIDHPELVERVRDF